MTVSIITFVIILLIFLSSLNISGMSTVNKDISAGGDFIVKSNNTIYTTENEVFFMNESIIPEIENITGVEKAIPFKETYFDEGVFSYMIRGVTSTTLKDTGTKIIEGKFPSNNNEVLIGRYVASDLDKNTGDSITIHNKTYIVSGIFGGNYQMDFEVFMLPEALNKTTTPIDLEDIELVVVHVKNGSNIENVKNSVEELHKGKIVAISNVNESEEYKISYESINTITNYLSLSAMIFGSLLLFYVMLSSVNSRVRELGVLKAVGWSNNQIITMIIGESMVISGITWIIGAIISVLLIEYIFPNILFLDIVWDIWIFIKALIIVIIIGMIGCLYPAYKSSKISPTEALRYE
ncbi:putative ABC transporter permease YknZ [Methanobrevibacter cuticularis]|uniref:Putative ABC transporter permease YknZ n=1 Tax=Methanobrevibacter cuticularis TaxID=47311 RepID=A0A166CS60_9EURY|nr:putative ABC transporter permease YknZ [Methanobrevibacter cuticularis]